MAGIFGILGLSDTERVFANTVGQAVVYDGIMRLVERFNVELTAALSVFVEEQTETSKSATSCQAAAGCSAAAATPPPPQSKPTAAMTSPTRSKTLARSSPTQTSPSPT